MKNARLIFAGLLLLSASTVMSGCYTKLATDKGDYYGYTGQVHRSQPVRSDTFIIQQHSSVAKVEAQPKYDTVMKGDTMFIDEHPRPDIETYRGGETIINNYYDDNYAYQPYESVWFPRPRAVFSITLGYPYGYWNAHSWYSPWYAYYPYSNYPYYYYPSYNSPYDWGYGYGYGYGYPGFYPPVYDCYSPYYAYGGYHYYSHHRLGDSYGPRGYFGHPSTVGRVTAGERRVAEANNPIGRPNGIAVNGQSATTGTLANREPVVVNRTDGGMTMVRQSQSQGEVTVVDRNAPVHAVAPGAGGPVTYTSNAGMDARGTNTSAEVQNVDNARAVEVTQVSNPASASGGSSGHRVVVVRRARSDANSYGGYDGTQSSGNGRSSGRSTNSGGTGYDGTSSGGYTRNGRGYSGGSSADPSSGTTTTNSGGGRTERSGGRAVSPNTGGEATTSGRSSNSPRATTSASPRPTSETSSSSTTNAGSTTRTTTDSKSTSESRSGGGRSR